jgi:hypothetical protein
MVRAASGDREPMSITRVGGGQSPLTNAHVRTLA